MALIDKKITNPIRYHQDNANTVIGQASTMKALFDQGAEDLRVKLNGVIDELLATTGAQQIGIDPARGLGDTLADALTNIKNYMNLGASGISATTIGTGSGNTVQSQLEWLLLQIQNVLLNQIPDGTITMQKLATALANTINGNTSNIGDLTALTTTEKTNLVGAVNELDSQLTQIQQDVTEHINGRKVLRIVRTTNIVGEQIIDLGFRPKIVMISAVLQNLPAYSSEGSFDGIQMACLIRYGNNSTVTSNIDNVVIIHSGTAENKASITYTETGFILNWSGTGLPAANISILVTAFE